MFPGYMKIVQQPSSHCLCVLGARPQVGNCRGLVSADSDQKRKNSIGHMCSVCDRSHTGVLANSNPQDRRCYESMRRRSVHGIMSKRSIRMCCERSVVLRYGDMNLANLRRPGVDYKTQECARRCRRLIKQFSKCKGSMALHPK